MRGTGKRFVYVLRSDADPNRHYVGVTGDVESRLDWHNHGPTGHTVDHRPWSVLVVVEFATAFRARQDEAIARLVPASADYSAAGIVMIATALARTIVTESALGLTHGHVEALAIVEQMLDALEPC